MPMVDIMDTEDLSGLVPLWEVSKDGYRFVLYSGNRVDVYKDGSSNPAYTVTGDGCTCRAAQYGNTNCKHRAAALFVGGGSVTPDPLSKQTRDNALSGQEHEVTNIYDLL